MAKPNTWSRVQKFVEYNIDVAAPGHDWEYLDEPFSSRRAATIRAQELKEKTPEYRYRVVQTKTWFQTKTSKEL